MRSVALPVAGPYQATWPELRTALTTAFGETTRCANWLMSELYTRDRHRQPEDLRLPSMPRIYLYPEARCRFPALASQTLATIEQQVQAKYRAMRLDLLWRQTKSLPTYRYPAPLPLPARMWNLVLEQERWHLSVRIGDRRWLLRLRQGPGMWRHVRVLRQVSAGVFEAGEAALYEKYSHQGDHRSDCSCDRRLMVKLAVWLPRSESVAAHGTLVVRTARDAFVKAHVHGDNEALVLNADHVRRWFAEASRRRQRLEEDRVFCQSGPGGGRGQALPVRRHIAERLRRRLDTWGHEASAQIVACARRRGVAEIAWDCRERGYLPSYAWHRFAATLADKAGAVGIRFVPVSLQTFDSFDGLSDMTSASASDAIS